MMHKIIDSVVGTVAQGIAAGIMRFPIVLVYIPERFLLAISYLKAKKIFWYAYAQVPAYKDFIDTQSFPKQWRDIPVTDKKNYIKRYPIIQTLLYGTLPHQGKIDTSTGTTGTPTTWIRGYEEMRHVKQWVNRAIAFVLGNRPFIFCNMFALGPWTAGMTSTYVLTGHQMVLSLGPRIEMLYDALKELGPRYRYVIAGYPPHMKKVVEHAPFTLHDYDIVMVVGGEVMTDMVYKKIIDSGVKEIISLYGASDVRINIAQHMVFEQQLYELCMKNEKFKQELVGTEEIPTFFRYNPLLDYIEEREGELIFTDLDQARVSPRIRYDLDDKGIIISIHTVMKLLKKYGYTIKPLTQLPILCLYGRGQDAISFNGGKLMYEDLEQALSHIPLLKDTVNRYAYNKFEDKNLDQQLELWLELNDGVHLQDLGMDLESLNHLVINVLCDVNQDFKSQIEFIKQNPTMHLPMPRVCVFDYGTSPMQVEDEYHKTKYVYNMVRE